VLDWVVARGSLGFCVTEWSVVITDANTGVPAAALAYVRAGFAIIPLHGVGEDNGCTCEDWTVRRNAAHGPGGKQAGKHPMRKQWTQGAALSAADVHSIWFEESPRANVGIRTGVVSGFWVLDVDPEAGGLESLARLVAYTGPLDTYTVKTGGDGLHFWWACPDFPVTNGSNREIKARFGPGLDIRGDGGQVVAPPSRSGKGAYEVARAAAINPPPARLLELLRAPEAPSAATVTTHVVEDLPFNADLDEAERARVEKYARAVIKAEADTYRQAVPGTGNETLFTSACSMLEIAQSPWNLVTSQEVYEALDAARIMRNATHPYRGGQDELEFAKTWASAQSRVVGQGRALPAALDAGLGFDPSPFSSAPAGSGRFSLTDLYPPVSPSPAPGQGVFDPAMFSPPSSIGGSSSTPDAGWGHTHPARSAAGVAGTPSGTEQFSNASGAGAQGIPAANVASGPLTVLDQLRALSLDRHELGGITPPAPLIEGVLDAGTLAVLSGQFGTFKTFIALDWLLCIATGLPWMGRAVPAAHPVRLIVGEGVSGLDARVSAWEKSRGVVVPRGMFTAVRRAWKLDSDAQMAALAELARERGEAVVAFDTLSQCAGALKENDSSDMARVSDVAGLLREHAGATTLLLHHAGHSGERARGSSVIEDNADTSWFVSLTADNRHHSRPRKLEHRKTKDAELTETVYVRFEQDDDREHGGTGSGWLSPSDAQGRVQVLVEGVPFVSPHAQYGVAPLRDPLLMTEGLATVAQVFMDVFAEGNGGTKAEVGAVARQKPYGMAKNTFYASWNRLVQKGVIARVHGTAAWRYLTPEERGDDV
jgi:hypothetical protein